MNPGAYFLCSLVFVTQQLAAASSSKGEGASRNIYSNVNPRKGWPYAAIYLKLVKKSQREEAGDDEKD